MEDGEFQHGVFMHYLIEGLQGKAGDETGTVTSLGLANYVSLRTKRYVAQHHNELQTPVLKGEVALFEFNSSMNVRPERPIVPPSEPSAEKTITNSIGMKLVLIPAGEFQMGSSQSENDNEGPQHQVHITKGFYLGKYPVTQGEYERVMGKNPSTFRADGAGKERVSGLDTSRFPVETVSWKDAVEFCRKLSEKEGKRYRLPTEAEWEYACRTRTKLAEQTVDGPEANCNANNPNGTGEKGPYLHRPTTVGSYRANDFELHDMLGNVQEWCADWYSSSYSAKSPVDDPTGPAEGWFRVLRGGGWSDYARDCRSARRSGHDPDYQANSLGFRVARESAEQADKQDK